MVLGHREPKEYREELEKQVQEVQQDQLGVQDHKQIKVPLVLRDLKALLVPKVKWEKKEKLDLLDV